MNSSAGGVGVLLAIWVIVSMIVTSRDDARKAATDAPAASRFPVADGSGHLICRNGGAPSEDQTVDDVHRFYAEASRFQMFLVPCPKCGGTRWGRAIPHTPIASFPV